MKKVCSVCAAHKAKRVCLLPAYEVICSRCCATIRNSDCQGCSYYATAEQYRMSRVKNPAEKHFVAEINEKVEEAVNGALELVEQGQVEKGKMMILDLMKEHPGNHTVHFGLGVVYAKQEQYDEAIACFEKATDIFPYFVEGHFNKAVAYKEKLDPVGAVRAFQKVIELGDPKDELVGEANRFIAILEKSLRETGGIDLDTYLEGEGIFNEAFSCMKAKEWGRALDGFKKVLEKNKNHVQSYGNTGLCYAQLGRKQEALEALDKALEIDPSYEPAISNRIVIACLREGEALPMRKMVEVEYYKDSFCKGKSYAQQVMEWSAKNRGG